MNERGRNRHGGLWQAKDQLLAIFTVLFIAWLAISIEISYFNIPTEFPFVRTQSVDVDTVLGGLFRPITYILLTIIAIASIIIMSLGWSGHKKSEQVGNWIIQTFITLPTLIIAILVALAVIKMGN